MKLISVWNEKMRFLATTENHTIPMDTTLPIGQDTAATPKQLTEGAHPIVFKQANLSQTKYCSVSP